MQATGPPSFQESKTGSTLTRDLLGTEVCRPESRSVPGDSVRTPPPIHGLDAAWPLQSQHRKVIGKGDTTGVKQHVMIWAKADDVLFHVRAVVRSCEWAYVNGGVKPDQWGGVNVWSAASPQAKSEDDGLVCANVYGLYWSGLLPAMMECAALCSSLSSQSCEDFFTPQVSRAPGSTV